MEANAKKPKAKARPKLTPTENAALKRLEHDLITDDGIVPATKGRHAIHCLTVIGTIEGHTLSPDAQKTTKYEHVIPQLVDIEEDPEIEGLLVILNTVGGDVEAGLALAELIAGVSKPSATLVLGGGHSIGIPLAVAARHSFIVPTATMTVHPVRHSGMVLGVPQTLRYFEQMQERIVSFVTEHSKITARRFTQLMHNTGELVMDMGTDQNGVKDGGHGDDGQHGGGELADHAEHGHLDDHEDGAGDKGGQEGCDNGDGGLDLTVLAGGVDDAGHEHGGDALGGKINERRSGGDLDHGSRDEANDERLADVGANDQDGEAEGRDDELGADHAARDA